MEHAASLTRYLWAGTVLLAALVQPVGAQTGCLRPSDAFGARGADGTTNERVHDLATFDDGSGPALYACGSFEIAGNARSPSLAKWDGQRWRPFPGNTELSSGGTLLSLAVFDDGSGPALYVGGFFFSIGGVQAANLARWTGTDWEQVGGGYARGVNDLLVFDDGSGSKLYVAGNGFTGSGGAYGDIVSCWDGQSWSTPGGIEPSPDARTLCVFDDGTGPALYVGGQLTSLGGTNPHHLARWNGQTWSSVGGGLGGPVNALAVHDDGSGPALYVGGGFTAAGGAGGFARVARWQNGTWSPLGTGLSGVVRALASYDDGGGAALFAAGEFTSAGGAPVNNVARWRSGAWGALGSPAGLRAYDSVNSVLALTLLVHDEGAGAGPALFLGGRFSSAGSQGVDNLARWSATGWSAIGDGLGTDGSVTKLVRGDLGSGEQLFAVGHFQHAGNVVTRGVAQGDGSNWSTALTNSSWGFRKLCG